MKKVLLIGDSIRYGASGSPGYGGYVKDLLADIAVMILGAILLVEGIKFCNSPLAANGKYASLPNLSKVWQYLPIPVAGGSMIIFELEQVFLHIEEFFIPNSEEAKQA
jgi:TRAP-type C4-dicarboxylate transport system permease small subunit